MMAKIVLFIVLLAAASAHKHHPKFRQESVEYYDNPLSSQIKKVPCTNQRDSLLNDNIEKSRCGAPKEVFVELNPPSKFEKVTPSHVWVKRCVGLCDFDASGSSECVAQSKVDKEITIRIHNMKTKKDTCATYTVEEHLSCGCCQLSSEECGDRIFNPRKCSCQCPNTEERRSCLQKRSQNMRWNRSKCTCEIRKPRRRVQ
ncbi:uncharacterized protein LOC128669296 isoform X1 [Plodia interpunctella]|uniref:uncharacterized protein LOC128669296 isoform X1 n=1 Tax=Plodia interpunctella TaxID=58824 RepID=UPI002368A4F6|nr:uncharacterized protein LOC128669296 isoform X1 [Plodia interpunctella]